MKKKRNKPLKKLAYALLPPRLLKYQIALRNYRRGEPEIRLLKDLSPAGKVAIDIGAFMGAYTWFLERSASHVHVFEPQPACAEFIQRACRANVTVHNCALHDHSGLCKMSLPAGTEPSQAARIDVDQNNAEADAAMQTIEVALKTLDEFNLDDVGFIKIDAEGAEENIIHGASQTLQRCRPKLLIEIEQRHVERPIEQIFETVLNQGYRGSFFINGEIRELSEFSVDEHQHARLAGDRSKFYINNFIFRPE